MMEKERIFKSIKKYDMEIRTIEELEEPQTKDNETYFSVDVGLFESLGEQGSIYTLHYDNYPTQREIIKSTVLRLKALKEEWKGTLLSAREENELEALNKIKL